MTEYEWRRHVQRPPKARPDWWGAQCIYPSGKQKMLRSQSFRLLLLLISLTAALLMPVLFPSEIQEEFADCSVEKGTESQVRRVSAIGYQLPEQLAYRQQTFTRTQLLGGRMLLIDAQHPLPSDLLPPNTISIAHYGNGMVPVRSLSIRSGYETIDALRSLFAQLRAKGAEGLYVSAGTVSSAQQREAITQQVRLLMRSYSPDQAGRLALKAFDSPGTGSLLQEYAIEIRTSDDQRLEESAQGQILLQLCWRYGFIRESDERPYRFRYVGKAHATAITYLDLDFEHYLEWLRQKEVVTVSAGGRLQYLILCKPMQGDYVSFDLPADATLEISLDNTGYALAACTL